MYWMWSLIPHVQLWMLCYMPRSYNCYLFNYMRRYTLLLTFYLTLLKDCSAHCEDCSSPSVCTKCQNSYFLYQSECFASCPDATFANTATTCQDCPLDCKHCSSASVCTECQSPYLLYQTECFASCPNTTFATSSNTCQGKLIFCFNLFISFQRLFIKLQAL